jgi:hypothetical protein
MTFSGAKILATVDVVHPDRWEYEFSNKLVPYCNGSLPVESAQANIPCERNASSLGWQVSSQERLRYQQRETYNGAPRIRNCWLVTQRFEESTGIPPKHNQRRSFGRYLLTPRPVIQRIVWMNAESAPVSAQLLYPCGYRNKVMVTNDYELFF